MEEKKRLDLFPAKYNNHIDLAKSELIHFSNYNRPDTIVYIDRLPVRQDERSGFVYFFKYKQKKDESNWKLASVGIVPADPGKFEFEISRETPFAGYKYNFNETSDVNIDEDTPIKDQLKKTLKKMQYSKRNSAAQFYRDEEKGGYGIFRASDFGD